MTQTLTDRFIKTIAEIEDNPEAAAGTIKEVLESPASPEVTGLQAYLYHEGIGVDADLEKCFELAEKAAFEGGDALGYFLLGYMCDNAETPDQAEGGQRQKYDQYDAERFYEQCAAIDSRWREQACLWLGDYYMDSAAGGDPDVGVDYYESIAETNSQAAGILSDYFWNLIMPLYLEDDEWRGKLFRWTEVASRLDPEEYAYRMGWLYADGIGCEKSMEKAVEYFSLSAEYGDSKGAEAVAKVYEEYLEEHPDCTAEERAEYEASIRDWKEVSERLHAEELLDDPDPHIEED